MKKLSVEDFAVLRGPFESGRQNPSLLGATLFFSIFLQSLLLYLEYHFMGYSTYPNAQGIVFFHFWVTVILILFSVIYSFRMIYRKSQKAQYLLVILVSQNMGAASTYLLSLFSLSEKNNVTEQAMLSQFTTVTLLVGLLVFIVTFVRFYFLLSKGEYRKGSKRDLLRGNLEAGLKSNLSSVIVGSTGLVFILQFLVRNVQMVNIDLLLSIVLPILIFFTMLFVLPEQLVILYCKNRFKSFNFDDNGYLYPEEADSERKLKNGN